jgi:transposase
MDSQHCPEGGRVQNRAMMVALNLEGIDRRSIALFTEVHPKTVSRWIFRVEEARSLHDAERCGRPRLFSESSRLAVIAVYCQQSPPLPGVHRWSLRDAEKYFKEHLETLDNTISHSTIQRILLEHSLQPHRRKYYLQITDPDFFPKMEQILACYSNPPENLYCFDECTCIQALSRLTPTLPVAAAQPVLEDFDYRRHGTTDLLAFLNPAKGSVYAQCTPNHDRHSLCRVFSAHVKLHRPQAEIHYIMDNLNTHFHDDFCHLVAELSGVSYTPLGTGAQRRQWLQSSHKRIVVHFIPFHASWLNMVEIWFGILKAKCLRCGHFLSVSQLRQAILSFIDTWNNFYAHPFHWSYTGEGLHEKAVRRFCRLLEIETVQMDSGFLAKQLLLMNNIAKQYRHLIPMPDWDHLVHLIREKSTYITHVIESDSRPKVKKNAVEAYSRFLQTIIAQSLPITA